MRASVCVGVVFGLALAACKSTPQPMPPRQGPPAFDEPTQSSDTNFEPASDSPNAVGPGAKGPREGCAPKGQVWDGKHEGCLYEVAGCCYPDDASACAAAGCEATACHILESAPAQIRCTSAK